MASVILAIGLTIFVGHLLLGIFKIARIPDVLLLIGLGILLGPQVLGWVKAEDFGKAGPVMTTIALIIILFEGGTGLKLATMRQSLVDSLAITLVSAAITMALVTWLALPFLGDLKAALIVGAILSGTSSAVVIPMVKALGLGERTQTVLILESALTDVLTIVIPFALLAVPSAGEIAGVPLARDILTKFGMASLLGLAGGLVWVVANRSLRRFPNTFFAVFAYVFILYGLSEMLAYNGAISVLVCGITLANAPVPKDLPRSEAAPVRDVDRALWGEMVFLVKLFFFIYLGLNMCFDEIAPYRAAAIIVAAVYGARLLVTRILLRTAQEPRDGVLAALMVPKGLAAAVIAAAVAAQVAATAPELGARILTLVYAVVLLSIIATSVLVPLCEFPGLRSLLRWLYAGCVRHAPPASGQRRSEPLRRATDRPKTR